MLFIVYAGGVGKVGALAAQLPGLAVHVVHKGLDGAVHRHGQHVGRIGGGGEKQAVQQLLHRQLLPQLEVGDDIAAAGGNPLHPGLAGGEHGVRFFDLRRGQ